MNILLHYILQTYAVTGKTWGQPYITDDVSNLQDLRPIWQLWHRWCDRV